MKIVIADDSSIIRVRIREQFASYPDIEIVGEALNGTEALRLIEEKSPDFAIIDIRMPDMNGIEVLVRIREKKFKTKVFIFTNYPYKQYRDKCLAEGAADFFDKNRDIQKIVERIVLLSGSV